MRTILNNNRLNPGRGTSTINTYRSRRFSLGALLLSLLLGVVTMSAILTFTRDASAQLPASGQANSVLSASKRSGPSVAPLICGPDWTVVQSTNVNTYTNTLNGLAAISSNDIWAVGVYAIASTDFQTLAEHWDGTSWNIVYTPNVGTHSNALNSVAALASNDVWAVGDHVNAAGDTLTLVEHWDGTSWTAVTSPNMGSHQNILYGVAAVSANDVWAVGVSGSSSSSFQTYVLHWDGTSWGVVTSPTHGTVSALLGITAISSTDLWAVGAYANSANISHTLIAHYDGTAWTISPSPDAGSLNNILYGVTAVSANDVWTAGYYQNASDSMRTLAEHWNGTSWSIVYTPNVGAGDNHFTGIAAASATDVRAVGYRTTGANTQQTLTERYNGTAWSVVTSPNVGSNDNALSTIAVVSSTDWWAAGYSSNNAGRLRTLTLRYNPCPGTPTATATPTACSLQFEDVPNPSTFYSYVRCLACRGAISGYACGNVGEPCNTNHDPYFRPNNNVTRGQIAKIIALSLGTIGPVSGQSFEDVPPGTTFYTYTEQLYSLSAMSGYACGGVGEPCNPPNNRPYFRPNANATRGQLAKIDSNAAGFSDVPTGQTFEDVPPASTFYTYTQRLTSRGVMSGYACGSPEPCVPPANLPYFRPNANVTRGQTSKIASNTFFPNCQTPER